VSEAVVRRPYRARLRKLISDELSRSVARVVVYHDHVGADIAHVIEHRRKQGFYPVRLVRRNGDDREIVHVIATSRQTAVFRRYRHRRGEVRPALGRSYRGTPSLSDSASTSAGVRMPSAPLSMTRHPQP